MSVCYSRLDPQREGARLEGYVISRGVCKKTLAQELGTDEGTLSKIFHGKQVPSYLFLTIFGLKVEALATKQP